MKNQFRRICDSALSLVSALFFMALLAPWQTAEAQENPLARFPVAHEHSSGWCMGYLYIYADSIAYEVTSPATDGAHSFRLKTSELQEVGRWMRSGQQLNAVELKSGYSTNRFWWIANERDVINGRAYQFNPPDAGDPEQLIAAIRNPASLNTPDTLASPPAMPQPQQNVPVVPAANSPNAPAGSESRYAVSHVHTTSTCFGYLYVSATRVRYEVVQPESEKKHSFDLSRSEIKSIQQWILLGSPVNATELKTLRSSYHFWLLPEDADLSRTPIRQLSAVNPLPAATLIAALRGEPVARPYSASTSATNPYPARPATAIESAAPTPATQVFAQGTVPTLRYDEPNNFYHSANTPPDDYSSTEFNASFQIYPFRPFNGDIGKMFQTTLLREWIDPRFRETNVAGRPEFKTGSLPGAQYVISARFFENNYGMAKPRLRWLIVAGSAAALLDINASDAMTWQRALPLLDRWFASLRVESGPPAPTMTQNPGPAARAVAGLYMALVYHPRAFVTSSLAAQYYLFSAEGRVYRAYDDLSVPGGNPSRFDFDAAQRQDPGNSGFYNLDGNRLVIQMGRQGTETITATLVEGGNLKIGSNVYTRE